MGIKTRKFGKLCKVGRYINVGNGAGYYGLNLLKLLTDEPTATFIFSLNSTSRFESFVFHSSLTSLTISELKQENLRNARKLTGVDD